MRPTWTQHWTDVAFLTARRSTCLRRQVGAVAVKNDQLLATGYNGAPRNMPHCKVCLRQILNVPSGERDEICRAVHAEQNVIIQAAVHGVSIAGATLYVTNTPCTICAKMIVNANFEQVVIANEYPGDGEEILTQGGVVVRRVL